MIIIIGALAALGISNYSNMVESNRLAEAKAVIGSMRTLAYEYYLKNGNVTDITNDDVGVNNTCSSSNFYRYSIGAASSTYVNLLASRCSSDGKTPNASRRYVYYLYYRPDTGQCTWHCYYNDDVSSCFGLPP